MRGTEKNGRIVDTVLFRNLDDRWSGMIYGRTVETEKFPAVYN